MFHDFLCEEFQDLERPIGAYTNAVFLIFFVVLHDVGNLHVFKGPDDFNGYDYFSVRL